MYHSTLSQQPAKRHGRAASRYRTQNQTETSGSQKVKLITKAGHYQKTYLCACMHDWVAFAIELRSLVNWHLYQAKKSA